MSEGVWDRLISHGDDEANPSTNITRFLQVIDEMSAF